MSDIQFTFILVNFLQSPDEGHFPANQYQPLACDIGLASFFSLGDYLFFL